MIVIIDPHPHIFFFVCFEIHPHIFSRIRMWSGVSLFVFSFFFMGHDSWMNYYWIPSACFCCALQMRGNPKICRLPCVHVCIYMCLLGLVPRWQSTAEQSIMQYYAGGTSFNSPHAGPHDRDCFCISGPKHITQSVDWYVS